MGFASWFAASYFLMTSKYHKHTGPVQRASAGRHLFSGTTTVSFGLIFTGVAINSIFFAPPHLINTMLSMLLSNNISLVFNCYFNCIVSSQRQWDVQCCQRHRLWCPWKQKTHWNTLVTMWHWPTDQVSFENIWHTFNRRFCKNSLVNTILSVNVEEPGEVTLDPLAYLFFNLCKGNINPTG